MSYELQPARVYRSSVEARLVAKIRRDELMSRGLCLNGGHHGPAVQGPRCAVCAAVHAFGKAALGTPWMRMEMLTRELRRIERA